MGNVEEERALKMNETTKPAPKRRHPKKSPAGVATRNRNKTKRGLIKCRMIKTSEFRVVGFKDRKDDAVFYLKKTK